MSLYPSPTRTAVAAQQRQHELQREAAQWRAATRAVTATTQRPAAALTPHPGAANRRHAGAASWLARAARRRGLPLPARPAPGTEAWAQG